MFLFVLLALFALTNAVGIRICNYCDTNDCSGTEQCIDSSTETFEGCTQFNASCVNFQATIRGGFWKAVFGATDVLFSFYDTDSSCATVVDADIITAQWTGSGVCTTINALIEAAITGSFRVNPAGHVSASLFFVVALILSALFY